MTATCLPPLPDWAPEFCTRPPYWGGHLQTLSQKFLRTRELATHFEATRHELPLDDGTGNHLIGMVFEPNQLLIPEEKRPSPLIALLHGLGGTSQSNYIQSTADFLLRQGHRVLLIDFRGAGSSAESTDQLHHPGRTEDIARLLTAVDDATAARLRKSGVVLVGYSLGGSVLLKFLAESSLCVRSDSFAKAMNEEDIRDHDTELGILGAVTVSAPLDLADTAACLARPSRWVYEQYLLKKMRKQAMAEGADVSAEERERVAAASSIREFDRVFTSRRCGFETVQEYYESYSAGPKLAKIDLPTLLIHAVDDPFVPAGQYHAIDWSSLPQLQPMLVPSGGHCGFQCRNPNGSWHDHCIDQFVRRLIGWKDSWTQAANAPAEACPT